MPLSMPRRILVVLAGLLPTAVLAQSPPLIPLTDPMPSQAGVAPVPPVAAPPAVTPPLADPLLAVPPTTVATPGVECDPVLCPPPRRFELFPTSLLWEPLLGVKRDPRFGFTFSDVDSRFSRQTADPSIGSTVGISRYHREGSPVEWQFDMFAVVHSRFSQGDFLIDTDYRAGALGTARAGNWAAKFGWEHTSTHLGDETIVNGRGQPISYERDEAVFALSYLFDNQLRAYGQVAWSFYREIGDGDGRPDPYRYDIGFDWYKRVTTGRRGQPFAAVNVGFDGATNYDATFVGQIGWMWKVTDRRLSQFRVYAEFMDGRSPLGQTYAERERYAGMGFAVDY